MLFEKVHFIPSLMESGVYFGPGFAVCVFSDSLKIPVELCFLVHRQAIRRMSQCWSEDWLRLWWGVMVPGDAASLVCPGECGLAWWCLQCPEKL